MATLNESIVEDAALEWFRVLGYATGHGPHMAPGEPAAERDWFRKVMRVDPLYNKALLRLRTGYFRIVDWEGSKIAA